MNPLKPFVQQSRLPLSTSAFLTHSFRVWAAQPIFAEIDMTACRREACRPSLSRTNRTVRSRTSGENLFVVLRVMLHPTQELEPPANPARFKGIHGQVFIPFRLRCIRWMSASRPLRSIAGSGGQPGMCRSTGTTASMPPATA